MRAAARGLAGARGWRRALAAFLLGVSAVAALPPFQVLPALVIAFSGLIWMLSGAITRRQAFWDGWWFGLGFLVFGLYWIAN
ncbi:MAG: apolipoprotein N-acyltransferase, partial [Alphaproteobacteria bacterium]|nr:apolipoprotein N-acyltransferase [Alphaproteobacteria bacterium]